MVASLPPFNPAAPCPKCGHDNVGVRWKGAKTGQAMTHSDAVRFGVAEWLMRHCERCGFNWDEACVDSALMSRD